MGRTLARISPTAGSSPLNLNEFKDGRGKMGWRNVLSIRLKCCSMCPVRLTSLGFSWSIALPIRYGKNTFK